MKRAGLSERGRAGLWIGALIAIWAAYFGGVVLARGYLFFGDITWQDHPLRVFYTASVRAGHLPLWNPYLFGGFPQFAEGQTGALYPLSLLAAWVLAPHVALTWLIVLHRLLAGLFMFALARAWGMARSSAFIAGLVFMFSGFLFAQSQHWGVCASAAYIPLLLAFIEMGLRRGRAIYAVPAGAVLAAQVLIGSGPVIYLSAFCAVGYTVLRGAGLGGRVRPAVGLLVGTLGIGGLLAAVQILPSLDLAAHSARTVESRLDYMTSFGLPPRLLALFAAPNTWGNPAYGDYHGPLYYWEYCAYLGVLALALAGVALARRWRDYWPLAALAAAALTLAVGRLNPIYHVLQYVPGVNLFRVPARYLLVVTACLALLAGGGHEVLLGRARSGRRWTMWLLPAAPLLAGWAWLTFAVLGPGARYSLAGGGRVAVALLVLGAGALVVAAWKGAMPRIALTGAAACVILADLLPWGASQMPTTSAAHFTDPPASAKALRKDASWFRIMTWRQVFGPMSPTQWKDREAFERLREYLAPDLPAAYGLNTLEGYSGFFPARQVAFFHLSRMVFRQEHDTRVFDAAGVRYIVSEEPLDDDRLALVQSGEVYVYRNAAALGPCWVVPARTPAPLAGVPDVMMSDGFAPAHMAAVEQEIAPLTPEPDALRGEARLVGFEPTRMEFEASSNQPALLVINAAAYDSDWTATLDGERAAVYPANEMFQAVHLPAGRHRVVLRYDPVAYVVGRQVTLGTAGLIVLGLVWRRRRGAAASA